MSEGPTSGNTPNPKAGDSSATGAEGQNLTGGKTVSEKPADTSAPTAGLEREDAQASGSAPQQGLVEGRNVQTSNVEVRKGLFHSRGSGDTSGYGEMQYFVEQPHGSNRPFGGWFDEVADAMALEIPAADEAIIRVVVHRGEITFHVAREHLFAVAKALRDVESLRFEVFSGVSGVHYPAEAGSELHAVYHLLSITHNRRIRLEVSAPDADPHIPSLVALYPAADWHERETWDMFGLVFDGHPALTRILMPDDWPGFPQRKDYPLGGIPVEYKGATIAPPDQRRSYN